MRILNIGSLNLDKVYDVAEFVTAGKTILAENFASYCGGKGLNQSIALAKAGARVFHAGAIGPDGMALKEKLEKSGVDVSLIRTSEIPTGHAIIQVNAQGQNSIIVYGGANRTITQGDIDCALESFGSGDLLLLQNETSNTAYAMQAAKKKGMLVAFNASPVTPEMMDYPLSLVDYFLINETEGQVLSGTQSTADEDILDAMARRYDAAIVFTVGSRGAYYQKGNDRFYCRACEVPVVDTTAAGDTFCGYFLAGIAQGISAQQALSCAGAAGGLAVSKKGASDSIPEKGEVLGAEQLLRQSAAVRERE